MPLIGQSAAIGLLANLRWCSEYQQLPNADINTNRNPTFITCAKKIALLQTRKVQIVYSKEREIWGCE